jgi:hypothetical protein
MPGFDWMARIVAGLAGGALDGRFVSFQLPPVFPSVGMRFGVVVRNGRSHPGHSCDLRMTSEVLSRAQTVRSASVGERRAARMEGYRPAMVPMMRAAPTPPYRATAGIWTDQCWLAA